MGRKPKTTKKESAVTKQDEVWPKVIQGSHSTRIEYEDGTVEFTTDWEALKNDVAKAIAEYESGRNGSNISAKKTS